jgi:hypothetical protein
MDMQTPTSTAEQSSKSATRAVYTLENCEIVRAEYFAHISEPTITFRRKQVYVNAACLKRTPETEYVQFLIDRTARRLILRPCDKRERDSIRLRTLSEVKTKPRHILGEEFFRLLFELMPWSGDYCYKVLGNEADDGSGVTLIVFDLAAAEKYSLTNDGGSSTQKKPVEPEYPQQWSGSFGATVDDHRKRPPLEHFKEDIAIPIASNEIAKEDMPDSGQQSAVEV